MDTMKASVSALVALLLGVSAPALLGACGSSTKTVSVAGAPPVTQTTTTGAHEAGSSSTPATTPGTTVGGGGGSPAPTTTRTAPEPAFTEKEDSSEGLSAATAVLRAKGYTPANTSVYHPNQALRVLIGTRAGSSDGYGQQAFFFVNGRYIGTDSKEASATVSVLSQNDTEVTLAYPLYRRGDPLGNPSAGVAKVRFQLNNGQLAPLDPIPPASSASGRPSRQ
jgi:LppP/LprE lipoprotein